MLWPSRYISGFDKAVLKAKTSLTRLSFTIKTLSTKYYSKVSYQLRHCFQIYCFSAGRVLGSRGEKYFDLDGRLRHRHGLRLQDRKVQLVQKRETQRVR